MNLNEEQLGAITRAIDERHRTITAAVREHMARLRGDEFSAVAGAVGDQVDQALADLTRDSDNAAVGRDVRELRELEAARARIAREEYGVCIGCGQEIGFARLLAQPTATRCLTCQAFYERTYAQPGEPSL
jgi:RNA polymerase-binding protein DksA